MKTKLFAIKAIFENGKTKEFLLPAVTREDVYIDFLQDFKSVVKILKVTEDMSFNKDTFKSPILAFNNLELKEYSESVALEKIERLNIFKSNNLFFRNNKND